MPDTHKLEHKIISECDADKAAELLSQYLNDGWSVRATHYQCVGVAGQHFVFILSRCATCAAKQVAHSFSVNAGSIN